MEEAIEKAKLIKNINNLLVKASVKKLRIFYIVVYEFVKKD